MKMKHTQDKNDCRTNRNNIILLFSKKKIDQVALK